MISINFSKSGLNAINFTIIDHRDDRIWTDSVRIDEQLGATIYPAREALSTYGFWLDLKKFVGDKKPKLECNDLELLCNYYKMWCRDTLHPNDPWPFEK